MARSSDLIREVRSYVVFDDKEVGITVKGSHWAPGYTEAHKATPDEAIDFAIAKAEEEMQKAQARVVELWDYKATMMSEDR